jgi:DinB family protein
MRFRSIAILALVVTVSAARLPAAALTPLEREHLVAHLEMTAAWLADEVTGLTAAQIAFRPDPDAWSIAQVVDHIVVVAPIYWRDLQTALERPAGGRTSGMSDADVLWYGIDRTRREQAIAGERISGESRDMPAALAAYRKHHDRLLQYIRTTNDDLRGHIVERQRCDAYQWALLISTHEQRHILQIREIKANPRFPKK